MYIFCRQGSSGCPRVKRGAGVEEDLKKDVGGAGILKNQNFLSLPPADTAAGHHHLRHHRAIARPHGTLPHPSSLFPTPREGSLSFLRCLDFAGCRHEPLVAAAAAHGAARAVRARGH